MNRKTDRLGTAVTATREKSSKSETLFMDTSPTTQLWGDTFKEET